MSQWIKKLPIVPIYLAFILVWAYFAVYSGSSLAYFGLGALLLRLFFSYPLKKSLAALAFLSLFVFFFLLHREMAEQAFRQEPPSASSVQVFAGYDQSQWRFPILSRANGRSALSGLLQDQISQ